MCINLFSLPTPQLSQIATAATIPGGQSFLRLNLSPHLLQVAACRSEYDLKFDSPIVHKLQRKLKSVDLLFYRFPPFFFTFFLHILDKIMIKEKNMTEAATEPWLTVNKSM